MEIRRARTVAAPMHRYLLLVIDVFIIIITIIIIVYMMNECVMIVLLYA